VSVTIVHVRTLLRHLGARAGISIGLLVMVVVVVVVARILPHSDAPPLLSNGAAAQSGPPLVVPPVASASAAGPLLHSPAPPSVRSGFRSPQAVAKSFALAWLRHDGVSTATWLRGVTTYSTATLAAQLAETNPANVPASRVTKVATVVDNTADNCVVNVPMDTGTLALTMTATNGHWLVDAVDWTKS
jgi:hypothetical protein